MKSPSAPDIIAEITRRQWLLRLGEAALLAGVSGLVQETPNFLFREENQYSALPPGLYVPSADDLVHALGNHKVFAPPTDSETDYVQPGPAVGPLFFSQEAFRTVTRLVEILLGKVEQNALSQTALWVDLWFHSAEGVRQAARQLDPMHRALAVAYLSETAVVYLESADHATVAREGIEALQKLCVQQYHAEFLNLDGAQQAEIIAGISKTAPNSPVRKFFETLRSEAIRGYYTSAEGLKELDYKGNAYYPLCPGCDAIERKDH